MCVVVHSKNYCQSEVVVVITSNSIIWHQTQKKVTDLSTCNVRSRLCSTKFTYHRVTTDLLSSCIYRGRLI